VRAHAPASYQDVLDSAYYSGWRRTEIVELTWDEVDLTRRGHSAAGAPLQDEDGPPVAHLGAAAPSPGSPATRARRETGACFAGTACRSACGAPRCGTRVGRPRSRIGSCTTVAARPRAT
jgi:hypothetical protein